MSISIKVANEYIRFAAKNQYGTLCEACLRLVPMDDWTKNYLMTNANKHPVEFLGIAASRLKCRFAIIVPKRTPLGVFMSSNVFVHIIGENRTNTIPFIVTKRGVIHVSGENNNMLRTGDFETTDLVNVITLAESKNTHLRENPKQHLKCALVNRARQICAN